MKQKEVVELLKNAVQIMTAVARVATAIANELERNQPSLEIAAPAKPAKPSKVVN
jgi:hypothetical protein